MRGELELLRSITHVRSRDFKLRSRGETSCVEVLVTPGEAGGGCCVLLSSKLHGKWSYLWGFCSSWWSGFGKSGIWTCLRRVLTRIPGMNGPLCFYTWHMYQAYSNYQIYKLFYIFSTFLQNNAWILKIATILKRSKLPHIIGFDCQDDLIKHIHPRIIALEKITKYSVRPWKS